LKISNWMLAGLASVMVVPAIGLAQTPAAPKASTPLQLNSLGQTGRPDPFPPVNPKFFTATSPTVQTVDSFLKTLWGYDSNRIWRVEAIQATAAPGVSKVVVFLTDKSANAKVQTAAFFVTPDGNHALTGDAVVPFGATPFAENRKTLQAKADGAARGSANKDLLLVEFSDLQCPHCKDAQETMEKLVKDFPNARVVYQSFPLVDIHPFAYKAAAYGACVTKQKNDAFFVYSAAVFDTQAALTPETGDQTLKAAVTKAGLDPAAIDACSQTQAIKDQVNASTKLAEDIGVSQTPTLAVNGNLLPMSAIPYETLKSMIIYQASLDGVSTGATASVPSFTNKAPTLGK
jgi:protein-disulfide isomerase